MGSKVELLVPVGRVRTLSISPAPRLGELKGKVIGFLQNGKPNADILLMRLAHLLREKYGLSEGPSKSKPRPSQPSESIEEMANQCQGVINGLGD